MLYIENNSLPNLSMQTKFIVHRLQIHSYRMSSTAVREATVLPKSFSAGPHGLGDPNDMTLRRVEREVLIPKIMRDKAKTEKCPELVAEFEKCCKEASILMVKKCQPQNHEMQDCLTYWYQDEGFRQECKEIYLKERSEYRATGIKKSTKRM